MHSIERVNRLARIQQAISQYRPGQVLELQGYRVRVHKVVPPDDYRDYGLIYLEGPRGKVPWMTWARVDEEGLHFEVPVGWLEQ